MQSLEGIMNKGLDKKLVAKENISQTKALKKLQKELEEAKAQTKTIRYEMQQREKSFNERVASSVAKQVEVQRLLEQNNKTLESRCELLEMQNQELKTLVKAQTELTTRQHEDRKPAKVFKSID